MATAIRFVRCTKCTEVSLHGHFVSNGLGAMFDLPIRSRVAGRYIMSFIGILDGQTEVALEQQVARRIAADDQLRENHEFRALGHERGVGVENFAAVAGKIADGRVELGETDAHGKGIKEATWRGFGGMTTPRLAPGASPRLPTSSHV